MLNGAMSGHASVNHASSSRTPFQMLKPICVELMGLVSQPVTAFSPHTRLVRKLSADLKGVPLSLGLINYVVFPITQIIRRNDTLPGIFLEAVYALLAHVVDVWKTLPGGMDKVAWEQLWRFVARPVRGEKGKGVASDEQALALLSALLSPTHSHPTAAMRDLVKDAKSPLMPTLFQTVTMLLDTPTLPSFTLLRTVLKTYLGGQERVLAALLPGTVSSVARVISDLKGDVTEQALGLVGDVVSMTLGDDSLKRLGVLKATLDDLSQLDEWSPAPSISSTNDPFPPLSATYLEFTSTQLAKAILPMLSLSSSAVYQVRRAAGTLALKILTSCSESLPLLVPHCLTTVLLLSQDDLIPMETPLGDHEAVLLNILTDAIQTFPRLVLSQQDDQVERLAKVATAIAQLSPKPISHLLGPNGHIERWSGALLQCFEFGQPWTWRDENETAKRLTESAWQGPSMTGGSTMRLRHLESGKTYRAIKTMLGTMGHAADDAGLHTVEFLLKYRGSVARRVSALWVAQQVLGGIAEGQVSNEGRVSRATRKMAREMARTVGDETGKMSDADDMEDVPEPENDALVPAEHTRGIGTVSLLSRPIATPKENPQPNLLAQRSLLSALSVSSLALSSQLLGSLFRPLLLHALYHLLEHLASPQAIVQESANDAIHRVARNTDYPSVQVMILDNSDYVIHAVSQRLTHARLSSTAPLVLIAMVRLVGAEIVPMVHDIVDEIFDALDDFHGYETLTSGLLAVLVALIEVMADENEADGVSEARAKKLAEMRRVEKPPDPQRDFDRFEEWFQMRKRLIQEELDILAENVAAGSQTEAQTTAEPQAPEEIPPTRGQEVCAQIVDKSLHFVSHHSPFLRARVLALITRAVPVLAMGNREGDLLPLIDRSWTIILNRLEDLPYVVTEAAQLVAALCQHCGDFMGRRVLDQAWPKMKKILEVQQKADHFSAMIGSEWTVSFRLHIAILNTAKWIVEEVPVNDSLLWEMMVLFRPLLDRCAPQGIQDKAMEVYKCLGERDGDALWCVLAGQGMWSYLGKTDAPSLLNNI
ncbi:hypothetical protein BD324DRAFT_597236 [Kockovaella imperatae]|uniref:Armadillo-type protein n=1 Tax=Kockovaella imperatae TaxID=4999 RepID=A0A1Y1UNZ7_9TREE|nr:hypothetical protein BD324DRAFT_597236 [Kockovaella imperatae]ORX39722.1 hypothetical protein BD324DRAFT_597236 [Kockovaella imperatae]